MAFRGSEGVFDSFSDFLEVLALTTTEDENINNVSKVPYGYHLRSRTLSGIVNNKKPKAMKMP